MTKNAHGKVYIYVKGITKFLVLKLACQHNHNGKRKVTTPKLGVVVGEFCQWCPSSQHVKNDKIFETIQKKGVFVGYVLMGGSFKKKYGYI
jgi:hypothetical protein